MRSSLHILVCLPGVAHALGSIALEATAADWQSCISIERKMVQQITAKESSTSKLKVSMVHQCNAVPAKIEYEPKMPSYSCTISDTSGKGSCGIKKQECVGSLSAMKRAAKAQMNAAMVAKGKCDSAKQAHAASVTQLEKLNADWEKHPCKSGGGKDKGGKDKGGKPAIGEQNLPGGGKGPLVPPPAVRRRRNSTRRRRGAPATPTGLHRRRSNSGKGSSTRRRRVPSGTRVRRRRATGSSGSYGRRRSYTKTHYSTTLRRRRRR